MIKDLPPSLIDAAREAMMGIRLGDRIEGMPIVMGISRGCTESTLNEDVMGWFKETNRKNPHDSQELAEKHEKALTDEEKFSVYGYTVDSPSVFNHIHSGSSDDLIPIKDRNGNAINKISLKALDSAVGKNKMGGHFITYSGILETPIDPTHKNIGYVTHKSFTSSSFDPIVADKFARNKSPDGICHIARIHSYDSHKGLFVGHNNKLTHYPSEFEYIIPRNTTFRVLLEPEILTDANGNVTHHIWDFHRTN